MLNDFTGAERVYIACGYTDLRRGIDGLASLVQQQFQLDPFSNTLFLFCGRKRDRLKALYYEALKEHNAELEQKLNWLTEQYILAKHGKYAFTSEQQEQREERAHLVRGTKHRV